MNNLRPFRFWVQSVLPLVYDDSLSYYELLCKVVKYINDIIENLRTMDSNFEDLQNSFEELKTYVDEFFESEDFEQIISDKLDEMAESGVFDDLITPILEQLASDITDRVDELEDNMEEFESNVTELVDGIQDDTEMLKSSFIRVLFPPAVQSPTSPYPAGACQAFIYENRATLIDLGVYESFTSIRNSLLAQGVDTIDNIIISHFHGDHTGVNESSPLQHALDQWKNAFDLTNVHCYVPNDVIAPSSVSSEAFRACFDPTQITTLTTNGQFLEWEGCTFEAYNISQADFDHYNSLGSEYNAYSMLCYVTFDNVIIANTADFVKQSEEYSYATGYCRKCTIMTAPHHGINGEGDPNFAFAMSPAYTYISDNAKSLINGYRDASIAGLVGISRFFTNTNNQSKGVMFLVGKGGVCISASPSVISKYSFQTPTIMYVDGSVAANAYQDGTRLHPYKYIRRAASSLTQGGKIILQSDVEDTLYLTGAQGYVEITGNSHKIPYINLSAGADVKIDSVETNSGMEVNASKVQASNFVTSGTIYVLDSFATFSNATVNGDRLAFNVQRSFILINLCSTPDRTTAQFMTLAQSVATGSIGTSALRTGARISLVGSIADFGRLKDVTSILLGFWSNTSPPLIVYDTQVNKYGLIQSNGTIKYVAME